MMRQSLACSGQIYQGLLIPDPNPNQHIAGCIVVYSSFTVATITLVTAIFCARMNFYYYNTDSPNYDHVN